MKLQITITCENASFEEPGRDQEVANILAGVLDKFNKTGQIEEQKLFDTNGNNVGRIQWRK